MRQSLIDCLIAIDVFIKKHNGLSPSIHNVAHGLDRSFSYAHRLMRDLDDAGYINRRVGKHRSLEITQKGKDFLEGRY